MLVARGNFFLWSHEKIQRLRKQLPSTMGSHSLYAMCCSSATTIRLDSWKIASSLQLGLSAPRAAATLLCSRIHRVCITASCGCSLTRPSPALKHENWPWSSVHSFLKLKSGFFIFWFHYCFKIYFYWVIYYTMKFNLSLIRHVRYNLFLHILRLNLPELNIPK